MGEGHARAVLSKVCRNRPPGCSARAGHTGAARGCISVPLAPQVSCPQKPGRLGSRLPAPTLNPFSTSFYTPPLQNA